MLILQLTRFAMHADTLRDHADRIRASQVLGRSDLMQRLFDFLVACSLEGRAPKEIEIAIAVFEKNAQFEVARDAMVRVYMHKLRRKLDDYYAAPGRAADGRLGIPRGEYRLVFEAAAAAAPEVIAANVDETTALATGEPFVAASVPRTTPSIWRFWPQATAAALIILLSANLFVWWSKDSNSSASQRLSVVREHPLWNEIVNDDQPIYIVMGDYYIFGELAANSESSPESVHRLVREFNINSRNDLEQLMKERPELDHRYMDLALRYLPVSAAYAMHSIVPLLEPNKKNPRQVQVILASDLTPAMIRSSHIIYIGLTSGMGILQDIAFAGSQFRIGDTYDELVDRDSNQTYVSQSSISVNDNTRYRDYGYFSTFAGPKGNRIVILAGTRDVALMHTAEAVSRNDSLTALEKRAGSTRDFEALYSVDAIDRMNLDGQLLQANGIHTERIWPGESVADDALGDANQVAVSVAAARPAQN
jgi:hypothetical protein